MLAPSGVQKAQKFYAQRASHERRSRKVDDAAFPMLIASMARRRPGGGHGRQYGTVHVKRVDNALMLQTPLPSDCTLV